MRRFIRAAAVVLVLCPVAWLAAQSAPPPPQTPAPPDPTAGQRPTFRTEANFVRVDVYPTRDGKPVLDLTAADFEIAEDGSPQKVESFEHIVVAPAGPQAGRVEPNSQRDMLQAAANPRNRVFVMFLDTNHVPFESSHAISEPLIRLINRILGPDDLVGVMTPDMSAKDLVLARRTEVTEERLRTHWHWGDRFANTNDDREDAYLACYNPISYGDLGQQLIARKRERETLEALQDVVRYLQGVREERKAILTVTTGWNLFTPLPALENRVTRGDVPSVDPVGVGPDGKLTTKDPRNKNNNNALTNMECNADRMRLASIDDERFLRDIINDANRANTTFYPVNPRGLVMFETGAGSSVPLAEDQRLRRVHQESIHTLADGTDGIAVVDTNDLDQGLRKISDDLSSYYLLGYYSTNTRLDGGYRALKVRVKRPGVSVRARRGYRAASAEEVAKSRAAAAAPGIDTTAPMQAALAMLAAVRPDAPVRLRATTTPGSDLLWIAGELPAASAGRDDWGQGGTADLRVTSGGDPVVARVTLKPGDRTFLTSVKLGAKRAAAIEVQARVSPVASGAPAVTDTIRITATPQPLFYRRGPTTANRQVATADLRFTRADRAHLELPVAADVKPGAGRLLDRTGQPLAIPVAIAERTDEATGQRWISADVVLAPLAAGDYVIELGTSGPSGESRVVAGIRVVR